MPEENEDVETTLSDSPEVYQQTKFMAWFEKAFPWLLVGVAALGLIFMIFLPGAFFQKETAEQLKAQSDLRLALLYTTGGAIAVFGLLETYRKNTNDRTKANADIKATLKNQDHQTKVLKEQIRQFDENAFKERKAERRERYTKAIEQLGDEKASVRMGGVYTLVGLVDEWLEDESIEKYKDRLKEGQVIINNLCAYIRSPFTLASQHGKFSQNKIKSKNKFKKFIRKYIQRNFYINKANFQAEVDVRLSIIKEIHDRLKGPEENTPGAWSDFEYDFSGSTFFYPVDFTNSYYKKPVNFRNSTYHSRADFKDSTYEGRAYFRGSTYKGRAYFIGSAYQAGADFKGSVYQEWANFSGSTYQGRTYFIGSTYQAGANFSGSTYQAGVDFSGSAYQEWANFSGSTYQWANFSGSAYQEWANFSGSTYQWANFSGSTYQWANFSGSTYQGRANFSGSTYQGRANFSGSTYQGRADFRSSTYQDKTDFSGSIFYQETYFGKDVYSRFSRFTNFAPQFYDETNNRNTLFGSHNNDFTVDTDKGYSINLNSDGIPLGCKFLTSAQKKHLADQFQEIGKTKNKLREVKDPKEKTELSKKLQALNEGLHEWREEATTVKVEDIAAEDTES